MADYGLSELKDGGEIPAPVLDYLPPEPLGEKPQIALIGAGGIAEYHLRAYKAMRLDVVAICDINLKRAEERAREFYPDAFVTDSHEDVIRREEIKVVDIALHPEHRIPILRDCLQAGKHILSQKPFVTDLNIGKELVALAKEKGVKLAVNQNGRWAPHFSYCRNTVEAGIIGEVSSVDFNLHFDHTWTENTPFEEIHHLLLYDFGIHWFDISRAFLPGKTCQLVSASVQRTSWQTIKPPFLAQVIADFEGAQVRINLNAHVQYGQQDTTTICGSKGTLRAFGPGLNEQSVHLWTADGYASPKLKGCWFENGFEGTMGELLQSIEQNRVPNNNAEDNLESLAFCFAAMHSADTTQPQVPGSRTNI
jgi:predicted dehydrogenase